MEIIKRMFAAFQQHDPQALLVLFADDVELCHPMAATIWPWAGKRRGRAQVAEFFAGLAGAAEFERVEPREFLVQGEKAVVFLFERLRIRATGRAVDNEFVMVFTFNDGKISHFRVYEDTAPIIAAIRNQDAL